MADARPGPHDPVDVHSRRRIILRSGGRVLFLPPEHVDWIEAADNYVRVHTSGTVYVAREPLTALQRRLDGLQFLRIHRRSVVNVEAIVAVRPLFQGAYGVELRSGDTLRVGRKYGLLVRRLASGHPPAGNDTLGRESMSAIP